MNYALLISHLVVAADNKNLVFCGCGILDLTLNQIELSSTGCVSLFNSECCVYRQLPTSWHHIYAMLPSIINHVPLSF